MPTEDAAGRTTAADVRARARAANFALEAERAAVLAAICAGLSEADRRLAALPMGGSAAAGPPWGSSERDGGR
ncbi:MAG: hypothetical protein OXI75_16425 [Rhodospirillales bacterium]|nr:hypothetical protein [Rhodospirillales bacterium]